MQIIDIVLNWKTMWVTEKIGPKHGSYWQLFSVVGTQRHIVGKEDISIKNYFPIYREWLCFCK